MNRELLKKNFENHRFRTQFFDTMGQAVDYLTSSIENTTVGFGGSMTVDGAGLAEKLSKNNKVYSHHLENTLETKLNARDAEYYICSANGVSETGELVNIDGAGNRVSATLFGPKKVIFIVGKNKIEPTLDKAIARARNIASTKNCKRFGLSTPCSSSDDKCFDCNSPQRICNAMVIYERPMQSLEYVEVIFVDEELGY